MRCKSCKNEIPDGSIFCNWCGERQVKERRKKDEIKVPKARKRGDKWNIELRAEGISITEDTEDLCIAKAAAIRAGFLAERKKAPPMTLGEAVSKYIEAKSNVLSPSTIRGYITYKYRFASLMKKPLQAITVSLLQTSINDEARKVSPKTVKNAFGLIRAAMLFQGVDIDFSKISLPKAAKNTGAILTPEEIGRLIKVIAGNEIEVPVLLAVWLGLRRSEIAALRKSDFDLKQKTVTISRALVQNSDLTWVQKGTKTEKSTRVLSCPRYILDRVFLLPSDEISTLHPNAFNRRLQTICKNNDLPIIRFHDLRHCAASVMLLLNVPDKYAMERGGWSSKQTMTGRYQHTIDEKAKEFSETIDNFYLSLFSE